MQHATTSRLLLFMAIKDGCYVQQGNCKNTICNRILPKVELCIAQPPMNCPNSPNGMYWKLNKTLYGLARSAHHWYKKLSGHIIDDIWVSNQCCRMNA